MSGHVSDTVAAVERELSGLWAAPKEGAAPRVRASTMNLVVVSAKTEIERLRADTDALGATHAGRAFLVWVDGRLPPWDLSTEVSGICRAESGSDVCSDRVEVGFGISAATRAPSVIGALALSQVPVVVEVGVGATNSLVDSLVALADRVVVDSSFTPPTRIDHLATLAGAAVADRNFVRTFTFRDLIARLFDGDLSLLPRIRSVEIERTGGFSVDPAAMMLGWVASRLGWSFTSREHATDAADGHVAVRLRDAKRPKLGPGELVAIRFTIEGADGPLNLAVERLEDRPRVLCVHGAEGEHEHPLGFRDETWVLIKALDDRNIDEVYRAAVRSAAAWEAL